MQKAQMNSKKMADAWLSLGMDGLLEFWWNAEADLLLTS